MPENKSSNFWNYALVALIFFVSGAAGALAYKNLTAKKEGGIKTEAENIAEPKESDDLESKKTASKIYEETDLSHKSQITNHKSPSGKFTIVESRKIYSDKTSLETGETVNFFATLKNQGSKKKFLTHICFNHSGGVTFGCQLNINIDPGREFPIHNSMIFDKPGNYSAWLTWSQDKTNFYRPINAGTTQVKIN